MKIFNRHNMKAIFECEKRTIKETVEFAHLTGVDLRGAYLTGFDLRLVNLTRAYLRGVDFRGSFLRYANLSGADLSGADLRGANLSGADLRGADLTGANLSGADLRGANLSGADLRGADLTGADFRGVNLIQIFLPHYQVIVQKEKTRIGCKYFLNFEWKNFSDEEIEMMDCNALEFWNSYKKLIFSAMDSLQ